MYVHSALPIFKINKKGLISVAMQSIYVMESAGNCKIGVARFPKKRLRELGIGNRNIKLIYESNKLSNAFAVERYLHKKFSDCSLGREWFSVEDQTAFVNDIKNAVADIGEIKDEQARLPEEMLVKEDGVMYTLADWIAKTEKEIEEMAQENERLLRLAIEVEAHNAL